MKLSDFVKIIPPSVRDTIFRREYWSASIGEAEAKGETADDACDKCKKKIEQAFEGDYAPTLINFEGYTGIAWRTPYHWTYCIKRISTDSIYGVNHYTTRQEAIEAMRDQAACMQEKD